MWARNMQLIALWLHRSLHSHALAWNKLLPLLNQKGMEVSASRCKQALWCSRSPVVVRDLMGAALPTLPSESIRGSTLHVWDTLPLTGCAARPRDRQDETAAD